METKTRIKDLIEGTSLTLQQIANSLGISYKRVYTVWKTFPRDYRQARKKANYRASKLGDLNPMTGKTGEAHHNFVGVVADGRGYLMVLKPDWYTGRVGSKHVFQHSVVVCEHLEITEIPAGHCVHHCNSNRQDNRFENLVLLTTEEHTAFHQEWRSTRELEGATTIPKGSTLKWVEARRAGTPVMIWSLLHGDMQQPAEGGEELTTLPEG